MPKYSFILYTHSKRLTNLKQAIYFLRRNDPVALAEGEVLVVCQDTMRADPNEPIRVVCLQEKAFNKPKMVNRSVREAKGDVVVMLDGDRILPPGYFGRVLPELGRGEVVTTRPLYRLTRPHTNIEIETDRVERVHDWREPGLEPGKKNAFSGNTVMWRQDFLDMGGMDESYVNYGAADLDASTTCLSRGMRITYRNDDELHLWHTFDVPQGKFKAINAHSVVKYCQKWGRPVPEFFRNILREQTHHCPML